MKNILKTISVLVFTIVSLTTTVSAKELSTTPYEHMPIDTFIAGFPLESLVILGLFSYILGVAYVLCAVHLKNKNRISA